MDGRSYGPVRTDVRALWPEDWRTVRELRRAALDDAAAMLGTSPGASRRVGERYWRGWPERGVPLAAFHGDAPVGLVGVVAPPGDPATARLVALWVAPAARGNGVGDALVRAVVSVALHWGCLGVALEVLATNEPAIRLYHRHGFALAAVPPTLPGAVAMRLDLRPFLTA